MHWFRRPPYLRWALAGLIVAVAFAAEFRSPATVRHPFAADSVAPGESFAGHLEWRDVPAGMLPTVDVTDAAAARTVTAGEPVLPSHLGPPSSIPADWWSVPLPLPETATPGAAARVVIDEPPIAVEGVVAAGPGTGDFGFERTGLVAVPAAAADEVARAAARGGVTVLIGP